MNCMLGLFDDLKSIEAAEGAIRELSWDDASSRNAMLKLEETVDVFGKNCLTRQDCLFLE